MLYLYLDKNRIKLLYVKKTLLGQYESAFYEKRHTIDFLDENSEVINTDLLASALKEAITSSSLPGIKDKDTYLILPQESFQLMRTEVPSDIAATAINSFVIDKARSSMQKDIDNYVYDYVIQDNDKQKHIVFFALDKNTLKLYQEACALVDLQLTNIIPASLAYFKLFEKTLRKDKRENILYVVYDKDILMGRLYDSFGPIDNKLWRTEVKEDSAVEETLKNKAAEYESDGKKLNRLILSGENSDTVRQDTFTKNVGVWTNPLKRIIPHFYEDYLKIFVIPPDKTLPLLQYDVCIGAFIFSLENKNFSLFKKKFASFSASSLPRPKISVSKKEVFIFFISFLLSFLTFFAVSKINNISILSGKKPNFLVFQPTPTPSPIPPTPTPTIAIDKKELKIKVLNGSGVKGKATEVKDILKERGYEEILTGNADNFDYETTEIQIKKSRKNIETMIKNDLEEYIESPQITELSEDETPDIVIIFGKDFK